VPPPGFSSSFSAFLGGGGDSGFGHLNLNPDCDPGGGSSATVLSTVYPKPVGASRGGQSGAAGITRCTLWAAAA
jgi:hypothetical protein